jgi:hypothetical protein
MVKDGAKHIASLRDGRTIYLNGELVENPVDHPAFRNAIRSFVGPNLYFKLPSDWYVSAAWNVQVAGRAVGEPFSLDLTNFERHQVLFKLGAGF